LEFYLLQKIKEMLRLDLAKRCCNKTPPMVFCAMFVLNAEGLKSYSSTGLDRINFFLSVLTLRQDI
jgi:hypothetical protein